jgi:polar amino acid transport system substrate-binding protein
MRPPPWQPAKADVFYADSPVAGYAVKLTNGTLQTIGNDVDVAPEGIIIKKGDAATAQAVQKALQKLMDDGTYKKILGHWGVSSGAIEKAEINPAV